MLKIVEIQETKKPSSKCIAWRVRFTALEEKDKGGCWVTIYGGKGGMKASLTVNLDDLKSKINMLGVD